MYNIVLKPPNHIALINVLLKSLLPEKTVAHSLLTNNYYMILAFICLVSFIFGYSWCKLSKCEEVAEWKSGGDA